MNSKIALLLSVAVGAGWAYGKECVWTGEAHDGKFETAQNWEDGNVPAAKDRVVFRGSGEQTVLLLNSKDCWNELRFESGKTILGIAPGSSKGRANIGFYDPGALYVASGASAVISNRLCGAAQGLRLTISGGGDLTFYSDQVDNVGYFDYIDIAAGSVTYVGTGWKARQTYVRDGSVLKVVGNGFARETATGYMQYPSVCIDKGGVFDISNASSLKAGAVSGEGVLRVGGTCNLTYYLDQGPQSFGGSVEYYSNGKLSVSFGNATPSEYVLTSENAFAEVSVTDAQTLRFSPVADIYRMKSWKDSTGAPLVVEATNGSPVTVVTSIGDATTFAATGSGSLTLPTASTLTGSALSIQGSLSLAADVDKTRYEFGDGASSVNDADLSSLSGVDVSSFARAYFRNVEPWTLAAPLTGAGRCNFYGNVTAERYWLQANTSYLYGTLTIGGGRGMTTSIFSFDSSAAGCNVNAGEWHRGFSFSKVDTVSVLPQRAGVVCLANDKGELTINGGARFWLETVSEDGQPNVTLNEDATLLMNTPFRAGANVTAEDPCRFLFNGGRLVANLRDRKAADTFSILGTASVPVEVSVGEKGARMSTCQSFGFGHVVSLYKPLTGAQTDDGGFVREVGEGKFVYAKPFLLNGPVSFLDGINAISPAVQDELSANSAWFGSGDLGLRNSLVTFVDCAANAEIDLATGSGSELSYDGMSALQFGANATQAAAAKSVTVGGLARAGKGAVLYLWDYKLSGDGLFDGTCSSFKVRGGLATNARGAVRQPVVIYSSNANRCYFAACTAEGEVRAFSNYTTAWDPASSTADDIVWTDGVAVTVPKNTESRVGGLKLSTTGADVTVNPGAVLHIGNGTDAALVLADKPHFYGKDGVIDFGTSEGVFAGIHEKTIIQPVLKGSNGISFTAPPNLNQADYRWVRLCNANRHTGGTYVNGVRLSPENAEAFGADDVYVGDGQDYGGRIFFNVSGLSFANDFHVAGWGKHDTTLSDNDGGTHGYGALDFVADTELSGAVELVGATRVCCLNEGTVATISGPVTGDALQVYNGAGTLALTYANSYTGGTEIVASTVRLAKEGTLGSGDIVLDGGTLALDKTADYELPNRISGKGTIRLEGKGVVTLSGGLDTSDFGGLVADNFTLSLGNRKRFVVPSLDGFSSVTTDRSAPIDLYVLDGKPLAVSLPPNVTYHAGAYEPLGGMILIK